MKLDPSQILIHPSAIVESDRIGSGTHIWAFVHVMRGAVIGRNCNIGDGTFIEGGVRIGDNVTIKNNCLIWEGVTIADDAFVGPGVMFTNDAWPRSPRHEAASHRYSDKRRWLQPTRVAKGATLGAGAIILCGLTIGEYATVGVGAVVTRDIPPHALAYGAPARVQGHVCRCGLKLNFRRSLAICQNCGHRYHRQRGDVQWLGLKST